MMTRARALTTSALLFSCAVAWTAAQAPQAAAKACSLTWIGQESAIEEFLKTAPVKGLEVVPIGVTKPRRAEFGPGALVARAAWKALTPSYKSGFHESYKAEVAGYALDRLLEMRMVPPAVERRLDRELGAMILWVENTKMFDIKSPPKAPEPKWSQQVSRMKMFDQLIGNIDRNAGNILYDEDWHVFLIDHSRAFIEKKDLKGMAVPTQYDRALWERMAALDMDKLKGALGEWLTPKELEALLARRDRMRAEVDKVVAQRGEARVFF
jgi:hypothetical protein